MYVFNLIVGTGALTMPRAFSAAGWLLSLIMIVALAFTRYDSEAFCTLRENQRETKFLKIWLTMLLVVPDEYNIIEKLTLALTICELPCII